MNRNERRWSAKLAALDANLLVAMDALLQDVSVTAAGTRLGITQSAMSQRLARLRDWFEDPILVRSGRTMELSPFAERIKSRLHAAICELEAVVQDEPGFDPATARRRCVVATVDYLALVFLPRLRATIAAEAPGIDLAVHALEPGSIAPKLESGAVDTYLGVYGETERALETTLLYREPFCLLVSADHPLVEGAPAVDRSGAASNPGDDVSGITAESSHVGPEDYVAWPHIHVSPRREAGSLVDRALQSEGLQRRIAVEVPWFSMVPAFLEGARLVATVPASIGSLFAGQRKLAVLQCSLQLPAIDICVAWHPRYTREPASQWLRSTIVAAARDLTPG